MGAYRKFLSGPSKYCCCNKPMILSIQRANISSKRPCRYLDFEERIQIMPLKKSEDKISATRGVTPRVKAARRPAAPPVAVAATVAKAKSASPKAAKAPKPVPAATASLLNLNGAVNGPVTSAQIAERAY